MARIPGTVVLPAFLATVVSPAGAQEPRAFEHRQLGPSVTLIASPPDGNMLVVRGGNGALLVDALASALAGQADSIVREAAGGPPRWVVNTHYHDDHIGANARFAAAGADIIAHRALPDLAARDTTIGELEWDLDPADPAAMPTTVVDDSMRLDIGGEAAVLYHMPHAHTAGDLVVKMAGANLLHTGDIVEFGAYPFVDWWAGGSFDGVVAAVDRILELSDQETTIIPGHGPPLTRQDVVAYREMIVVVGGRVREGVARGRSADELVGERITAPWDGRHGGERQGARFVRLLHLEFSRAAQTPTGP